MFGNYLAAAFANLRRHWLYAAITIGGLAVSFAAAILIGLYLRDELSFDRFIPGYQQVYRVELALTPPGAKTAHLDFVQATVAGHLKLDFPEVAKVARLGPSGALIKAAANTFPQPIAWADPDFFQILRLPVLAGDPDAAMHAPDGLVLTREMARKYFGQDAPIGRTLLVSASPIAPAYHPMRVLAVLQDTPSSSHLTAQVFGSALAPFSAIAADEQHPSTYNYDQLTYVRLKAGATPERWATRFRTFDRAHYPGPAGHGEPFRFSLAPLKSLHFDAGGPSILTRPPGDRQVDGGIGAIGALIVLIAGINFVTLMTARATRRAVEVGIRKAVGASRRDLIVQFLGEAFLHVAAAMLLAVALAELLLPWLNAFVGRELKFQYLADPALDAALLAGVAITTLLAGAYPALVLSAFRPTTALKGAAGQVFGGAGVRQSLVVVQFAILIGLILMTVTIYRQTQFALHDALRVDTDQVLLADGPCQSPFQTAAADIPGVKAVTCASSTAMQASGATIAIMPDRSLRTMGFGPVDVGFFEIHGLRPVAGRFFARDHGEDTMLERPGAGADLQPPIVLNETAARQLGFARPRDAIGKTVVWARPAADPTTSVFPKAHPSQVIGIAPDFSFASVRNTVGGVIFYVEPAAAPILVLKLDRDRVAEAMAGLGKLWRASGRAGPPYFVFEAQNVQEQYQDLIAQEVVIGISAALALVIACLGLFALAAFTTERRVKEIGVRKAMGAGAFDILRLLLWQFTGPVLWANVIAWPLAFWVMRQWLHGFAYRVDLPAWLFVAASAAAVLIAWATVASHAWIVAQARPATALRYE